MEKVMKTGKARLKGCLSALCALVLTASNLVGGATLGSYAAESSESIELTDADLGNLPADISQARVSVHDPSVVTTTDGSGNPLYYVFGSHMGAAKTGDLQNWGMVYSENTDSNLFGKITEGNVTPAAFSEAFSDNAFKGTVTLSDGSEGQFGSYDIADWISGNTVAGNMWAPDVIYNPSLGKWCMYYSLNGAYWNSAIVLMTADSVEGPYVYQGPVVFSGFTTTDSSTGKSFKKTDLELVLGEQEQLPDKYQKINGHSDSAGNTWGEYWPHAIDPAVFYDDNGRLWLVYGSWSGGIYMLELDENTGLRDYTVSYEDTSSLGRSVTSDPYFGKKIAGGYYVSGEGSYIEKIGGYYYLFVSYGFYSPDGGYNMRVFRSTNPDGPYTDEAGNSAIFDSYIMNYSATDTSNNRGEKLMGGYKWSSMSKGEIAQGHNSVLTTADGKSFVIYHTKFNDGTAGHEVRVHQLFVNENGWLVAAPYEYAGETLNASGYENSELTGAYDLIIHKFQTAYSSLECAEPVSISLNEDGSITGGYSGSWSVSEGTPYCTININGTDYKGVFVTQRLTGKDSYVMTFTAVSSAGESIWGSAECSDKDAVLLTAQSDSITPQSRAFAGSSLSLANEGLYNTSVTWTSSNTSVISNDGAVNQVSADTDVTMTARIGKGNYYYNKTYNVKVYADAQNETDSVVVGSFLTDSPVDLSGAANGSLYVANPFSTKSFAGLDLSGGATIEFDVKHTGIINVLGTLFSFRTENAEEGRLYFSPGSYLGYNADGGFYDANLNNYSLVRDYIGEAIEASGNETAHVSVSFTQTGFSVSVDGSKVYDESIIDTENGDGTLQYHNKVLEFLNNTADRLYFGYGSWWGDKTANAQISNVVCTVGPIDHCIVTEYGYSIEYYRDIAELDSADHLEIEANPFYGKDIKEAVFEYTIAFSGDAAKNGWDGIISFYNTSTNGRLSIQTNPYICYNDSGKWIDINQPGDAADNFAIRAEAGKDYSVRIVLNSESLTMTVDGEEISYSLNGSGATNSDMIDFLENADQLCIGVGEAVKAYWWTEKATLKDIRFSASASSATEAGAKDTVVYRNSGFTYETISDLNVFENPYYGKNFDKLTLSYNLTMDESAAANGWDSVISFYNSADGGRVSIQTAPYICYNGGGAWMDINNPNGEGANDIAGELKDGESHLVELQITDEDIIMAVDGEKISYSVAGSGAGYADIISYISKCDELCFGVGEAAKSFWWTEICSLEDILITTEEYRININGETGDDESGDETGDETGDEPLVTPEEEDTTGDIVSYEKDEVILEAANAINTEDNPFLGKNLTNLHIAYTIQFADSAAANGWDGLFSFYNSETTGRVSIQSAPYVCYNNMVDGFIDFNKPDLGGFDAAPSLKDGKGHDVEIVILQNSSRIFVDGEEIETAVDGTAGVTFSDVLEYIGVCDQLTFGVGEASTAFWWTEICTLSNIRMWSSGPAAGTDESGSAEAGDEGSSAGDDGENAGSSDAGSSDEGSSAGADGENSGSSDAGSGDEGSSAGVGGENAGSSDEGGSAGADGDNSGSGDAGSSDEGSSAGADGENAGSSDEGGSDEGSSAGADGENSGSSDAGSGDEGSSTGADGENAGSGDEGSSAGVGGDNAGSGDSGSGDEGSSAGVGGDNAGSSDAGSGDEGSSAGADGENAGSSDKESSEVSTGNGATDAGGNTGETGNATGNNAAPADAQENEPKPQAAGQGAPVDSDHAVKLVSTDEKPREVTTGSGKKVEVAFTGLNDKLIKSMFTDEELALIESGVKASVSVEVKSIGYASIPVEDKDLLDGFVSGLGAEILGEYIFDISVLKKLGNRENKVSDISSPLSFSIPFEGDKTEGRYDLVRIHEGKATVLGTCRAKAGMLDMKFDSDGFSVYAIVYVAEEDVPLAVGNEDLNTDTQDTAADSKGLEELPTSSVSPVSEKGGPGFVKWLLIILAGTTGLAGAGAAVWYFGFRRKD